MTYMRIFVNMGASSPISILNTRSITSCGLQNYANGQIMQISAAAFCIAQTLL